MAERNATLGPQQVKAMTTDHIPGWDPDPLVSMTDCRMQSTRGRDDNCVVMCEQHTEAWLRWRRGCVTASNVHRIIGVNGTASKADTRKTYRNQLVAERITHSVTENYVSQPMKRGIEHEPDARKWYAERYGEVREVGFVLDDPQNRQVGCSPDGLVEGTNRGLEIKVLMPPTHCGVLHGLKHCKDPMKAVKREYRLQVQYCMWVTGLPRWDLVYYEPPILGLPVKVIEMQADAKLHAAFAEVVGAFCAEIAEIVAEIKEQPCET
jgi:putative phage-type endonuclease